MNGEMIHQQRIPSPHPKIKLYLVTYWSDGLRVKGYLAEPEWGIQLPGLLYLRGGIKNVGMVRIARIIQWAAEGFVVMAPFYRGNRGGEGQEDFGGEDRYDAYASFDLLKRHQRVCAKWIHVFGFSRGGIMALLTGIERDVASVTTWNGVSDMFLTYEERIDLRKMLKRVVGGTPTKVPERYQWRTPLENIAFIQGPVQIIHGVKDEHVSVEHAYRLERALREHGKRMHLRYFESYPHHFPPFEHRRILTEAADWMKQQQT
ncbi:alpha/beta hydrolase family protein [Halalkalibacterium ligniniphilum]|uniref:alpha/beta hydrolase family protein n=1 Tax=Halalkalibacterium ligniniphilum TaxID=1134413 RepID=UPI000345E723|nr:prolyl oligopeptidase family serine peptidase [Halalkalibacterium ligniniphilum]